ncbi:MAG: hypothetical protein WCB90_13555 [Methanosarcina sp.]
MVGKNIKVFIYLFLIISLLIFMFGLLVFSNPYFLNLFANSLINSSSADPNAIAFQAYSKEEFAAEFLNTTLTPEDDFTKLFENHYGIENKRERLFLITYDIQDPDDKSKYTLYGISKYTDLIYKNTRKFDIKDPKHKRIKLHRPRN